MGRPPKILFVLNRELGWRTYTEQFHRVLRSRDDFQWEVLNPDLPKWCKVPLKRHNMSRLDRLFRHVDPITAYRGVLGRSVRSAIRAFRPDLVHFGAHLPAASLLADRHGMPPYTVAFDATRVNMNQVRGYPLWGASDLRRERELLTNAIARFPWSDWAGQAAIRDYGADAGRTEVVLPSIDPNLIAAPRAKPGNRPPRVIFIGNDFIRKGGDMLHRWIAGPLAGLCELHIVSRDPLAKSLTGPGIVVHGSVPHPALVGKLLPDMDLLCHPTQSDMSAYVVVEAAFAGVPAVTSKMGGIPELVMEGETGWTLAPDDEPGFIRTLRALLSMPDSLIEAGQRARRHAENSFDANRNYGMVIDNLKTFSEGIMMDE